MTKRKFLLLQIPGAACWIVLIVMAWRESGTWTGILLSCLVADVYVRNVCDGLKRFTDSQLGRQVEEIRNLIRSVGRAP